MPRSYSSQSVDSDDEEFILAQREWEESLQQLHQLVGIVLLPYIGKWLGRKWSYIAYARYQKLGFTKALLFGS